MLSFRGDTRWSTRVFSNIVQPALYLLCHCKAPELLLQEEIVSLWPAVRSVRITGGHVKFVLCVFAPVQTLT